ncbi:hypothetical protein C1752_00118 [Acaryochloris thomasi RCC1774]|uniref:Glycosyl transferase family 28 C-terminal domain-containing protein n=1 Tax=Acaryochloris thomasi RCC1774 TaxID=1764569 RepID=A0A2W1JPC4_9CYAN|nr:glycosyltransferase [Acaryochloris thomasi]PZD75163.1 hypothetical protein C1752_00118 [Acaryochloris thomasi RCC1774]
MTTWLIYALGGGWGHLNRAIALGCRAAQQHRVRILTNSPYASWVQEQLQANVLPVPASHLELQVLSAQVEPAETSHQVQEQILNAEFDCLIVDTFPRGLGGELVTCLPMLEIPKVLIHRVLNPDYVVAKDLVPWVAQQYDLVLVPGEKEDTCFADLPQAVITEPWVMLSHPELDPINTPQPLVIISAAGNPDELNFWGELTAKIQAAFPQVTVRCLAFQQPHNCPEECWVQHWPGMTVLQQADVIVGGAGYNTIFEAVALGIPLISLPCDRRYDDQKQRAIQWSHPVSNAEDAIATLSVLLQAPRHQNRSSRYVNGADTAVPLIAGLPAPLDG